MVCVTVFISFCLEIFVEIYKDSVKSLGETNRKIELFIFLSSIQVKCLNNKLIKNGIYSALKVQRTVSSPRFIGFMNLFKWNFNKTFLFIMFVPSDIIVIILKYLPNPVELIFNVKISLGLYNHGVGVNLSSCLISE